MKGGISGTGQKALGSASAGVAFVALIALPVCFLGAAVLQAMPMLCDGFNDGSLALLLGSTDIFHNANAQPTLWLPRHSTRPLPRFTK